MQESKVRNSADSMPPPYALILVGVIPTPKDLEIARLLGWYRIPFRFAPKVVQVDYLAFYQPSSFGKDRDCRIEYYTDVRGVELTTRGELIKEEPNHPRVHEEYYKIQVGPLIRLQTPILVNRWKRITFLYTTGELFSKAALVNDLVVKTEERNILWKSLREKANQSQEYHQESLPDVDLDPDILMMLGDLHLLSDDSNWYESI